MATIKKEDVLSYLESANMLEISELIKDIEDKFDVSAAAPVAALYGDLPKEPALPIESAPTDFLWATSGLRAVALCDLARPVG